MNVKSPIAHLVRIDFHAPQTIADSKHPGDHPLIVLFWTHLALPQSGGYPKMVVIWTGKWSGIWMCLGLLILRQTTPPCLSGEFADCAVNPFVRTPFGNVMPMQRTLFCIFLRETWVIFMFWMTQLTAYTAHRQMHHVYILQVSFCLMVSAL